MSSITARELMDACLEDADMDYSSQVSDKQLLRFINEELFELYDILIEKFEDFFYDHRRININTSSNVYALPDNFYKLKALFIYDSSDRYQINKFSINDLYLYNDTVGSNTCLRYRLFGNDLLLNQFPVSDTTLDMWYVPRPRKLRSDTDEINISVPVCWEEFVVAGAISKCLRKIEADPNIIGLVIARKAKIEENIKRASNNRDTNDFESVRDIYRRFN